MRLAKHLAHAGVASRRGAEALVFAGRVTIDGFPAEDPAFDVDGSEAIAVDGQPVRPPREEADRGVWLVNKPVGVVSTAKDTHGRRTIVELVPAPGRRLYPVGRLDADTSGLILLTDDGDLAHRMTHPKFEVPRTYVATLRGGRVTEESLAALRAGVELEDGPTQPAKVRRLGARVIELTIREGRKRQVRRMCEAVGHRVQTLERIAFGPLGLGGLEPGQARRLKAPEVERLRRTGAPRR